MTDTPAAGKSFDDYSSDATPRSTVERQTVGRCSRASHVLLHSRFYRIEEGSTVTVEEGEEGILIRPAVVAPRVEIYSSKRKAEFS